MKTLDRLYRWYGKKTVRIILGIIAILVIIAFFVKQDAETTEPTEDILPTVTTGLVSNLSGEGSITLIGEVKAVNQAEIETEVPGRITRVNVSLGDTVRAGQIIATQENASERAVVLQAQGSYEAAVAAARQSDVGVDEARNGVENAKNSALTTIRGSVSTSEDSVLNLADQLFSIVNDQARGLRIDGQGQALSLVAERNTLYTLLQNWETQTRTLNTNSDLETALNTAGANTERVRSFISSLALIIADAEPQSTITESDIASFKTQFQATRAGLNNTVSAINAANTTLRNSKEALKRAEIAGSSSDVSAADAQIKQALGSLRNAQASLEKTILRSPITGTVNTVSVDAGDFVGSFTPVAQIANNNGLEITTYVGESDRATINIGQEVLIDNAISGTITNIAPAIDSVTKKVEVRIAAEDKSLTNGDTVTISLTPESKVDTNKPLRVPLSAVKFTAKDGSVFIVTDGVLEQIPVTLGNISGSFVTIESGIDTDTVIVIDARGLAAGQKVEPILK